MATDAEALDVIENKIQELEIKVYGKSMDNIKNYGTVIHSLLQANTMMTAALSGRENITSIFKRFNEMCDYLDVNPLGDDPSGLATKLSVIHSVQQELESTIEKIEKINCLKKVLDNDEIKNTQLLKNDLTKLLVNQLSHKEKLQYLNNEVGNLLTLFNEICLEISKSFFLINEEITNLENTKK